MLRKMGNDDYVTVPIAVGGSGSGAVPQMTNFSDRGDLIEKIKPEAMVEIMRQRFLGKEFIDGRWVEVEALKKRKLTDIGAWEISNLMLGVSTINTTVSKLDLRGINNRAFEIARAAQRMMVDSWKEYGINSSAQFDYVHQILFSNTIAVLKQAGDGSIQELLKGTVRGTVGDQYYSPQKESAGRKIGRMLGLVGN